MKLTNETKCMIDFIIKFGLTRNTQFSNINKYANNLSKKLIFIQKSY